MKIKYFKHNESGEIAKVFNDGTWYFYSKESNEWCGPGYNKWYETPFCDSEYIEKVTEQEAFIDVL